jgi:HD-GYP domain-containing protein (c-di-GMP phosphodiesterase class II)
MSKQVVEVPVEQLQLGAYVSRLDRPWVESPFLFQGFEITTEEELAQLRSLCKTVHVEVSLEEAEQLRAAARAGDRTDDTHSAGKDVPPAGHRHPAVKTDTLQDLAADPAARRDSVPPKDSVPLQTELKAAHAVHTGARQAVSQMLDQLRRGRSLDVPQLETVVESMVESVMRNREAMGWLARMKTKDDYLYGHSLAVSVWSLAFGRHLGLDRDTLKAVGLGAMLLDIGKTRIDTTLLQKPAAPTEAEWQVLRAHVDHGLELLRAMPGIDERVITMVATHHERFDGSGYPRGLAGDAIPMVGRIAGIVDCYDAMTSFRSYAKPKSTYDAVREIKRLAGAWFQAELVELFIQAVGVFPTGSLVELNSGEVAVVVGQNRFRRLRPEVMLILDAEKKVRSDFVIVDLQNYEEAGASGPSLWIAHGLEPGAFGIDPTEYFL